MMIVRHLGPTCVFDGEEPNDPRVPLAAPLVDGASLATLTHAPVARLDDELGAGAVESLRGLVTLTPGQLDPRRFVDGHGLQVFRAYRDLGGGRRALYVTSYGEFQPGRYVAELLLVCELGPGDARFPSKASVTGGASGGAGGTGGRTTDDRKALAVLVLVGLGVSALVGKANLDVFAPGVLGLDPSSGDCTRMQAEVTNVEHTQSRKRTRESYYVEYRYDGPRGPQTNRERADVSVYLQSSIGYPIEVCVGHDDPTESVIVGNESQGTNRTLVVAMDGSIAAGVGFALVSWWRRRARA